MTRSIDPSPTFGITGLLLLTATGVVMGACSDAPASDDAAGAGGQSTIGRVAGGAGPSPSGGAPSASGGAATGGAMSEGGGSTTVGGADGGPPDPSDGTGGSDPGSPWRLVWADEFDGEGMPSPDNWTFEDQRPGWVNNELQNYPKDRVENAYVRDGSLFIEARRDNFAGYEYSSARIHTQGKAEFTYGRFEARAKLPRGLGTWPAIWMMPADIFKYATTCSAETGWISGCNAWPNSGEIDIMEHVGYDPNVVHSTIHCAKYNWQQAQQATAETEVEDVFDTFHVYAVERSPTHIRGYVDDRLYFEYENDNTGWRAWPFDEPFYFIVNIAVGGDWGGAQGVNPDDFPTTMEIDYIRAYEPAQ